MRMIEKENQDIEEKERERERQREADKRKKDADKVTKSLKRLLLFISICSNECCKEKGQNNNC